MQWQSGARMRFPRELFCSGQSPGTKQQRHVQVVSNCTAVYDRAGNSKLMALAGVGASKA